MIGIFNVWLVLLSVAVAVVAAYVALDLVSRLAASAGSRAGRYWFTGGAVAMGTGIWAMHFIGMLAFRLPIPMSYDVPVTLLSLLIAVIASGFALYIVNHDALSIRRMASAGILMGIGIASMHYIGMAAMEVSPPIRYDPLLFALSVLIAVAASIAALWVAFRLRSKTILLAFWKKAIGAFAMGAAISGMHYTGMAAAIFAPNSICTTNPKDIDNIWLAGAIGGLSFLFLAATLLISLADARIAERAARHAERLRLVNLDLEKYAAGLAHANALLEQEVRVRMQAEEAMREAQAMLETRVAERTAALAADIAARRRVEAALQHSEQRLRSLATYLQDMLEEERTHIAREIHDELGQALTGLKMDLSLLSREPGMAVPSVAAQIGSMSNAIDVLIQTVRKIATRLRPGELDDLGLVAAIESQIGEFQTRTGIHCRMSLPDADIQVDTGAATALYRICQELLTNVARHSGASLADIRLEQNDAGLALTVRDNGRGIRADEATNQEAIGMTGMRERAMMLGGRFSIRGIPGRGTVARVRIPPGGRRERGT